MAAERFPAEEMNTVLKIHEHMDYSERDNSALMAAYLRTKGLLNSEGGRKYLSALAKIAEDKTPIICIYCHKDVTDEEFLICNECRDKMSGIASKKSAIRGDDVISDSVAENMVYEALHPVDEEAERRRDKELAKALKKENWNRFLEKYSFRTFLIASAILIVIAVILTICIYNAIEKSKLRFHKELTEHALVENFSEVCEAKGYTVGTRQKISSDCYGYIVSPLGSVLLTFVESEKKDDNLTGVAIQMPVVGEESMQDNLLLMSVLNMCLYEEMTLQESTDCLETMINNGGSLDYQKDSWLFSVSDETVVYYVGNSYELSKVKSEVLEDVERSTPAGALRNTSESGQKPGNTNSVEVLGALDIISLIGHTTAEADRLLGTSEEMLDGQARYYEKSGISVIYDTETDEISYVECDGTGSGKAEPVICGIYCSMSKKAALAALEAYGIKIEDSDADAWQFGINVEERNMDVIVEFEGEKVALVCASLAK